MNSVAPQDAEAGAPPEGNAPADPPADGNAPAAEGEAPAEPADGGAPAEPAEGGAPAVPAEGEAPAEPGEGEAPVKPAEGEAPAEPAESEAPAAPAEGEAPAATAEAETPAESAENVEAPAVVAPEEPAAEEAPAEAGKEEGKCKPSEILTAHKGCMDRDIFIERVLQQTWMGEGLESVKNKAGMEAIVECQPHEILTVFGCSPEKKPLRKLDAPRAPVVHGHLVRHQVFMGEAAGGANAGNSKTRLREILAVVDTEKRRPRTDVFKETDTNSVKKEHKTKRGRYVFIPGRRIPSGRKCRPYEVLARHNRCIRKLGKVGFYQHKTHVYRS